MPSSGPRANQRGKRATCVEKVIFFIKYKLRLSAELWFLRRQGALFYKNSRHPSKMKGTRLKTENVEILLVLLVSLKGSEEPRVI